MKQHTIEVTAYVSVIGPDDLDVMDVPMNLETDPKHEIQVVETEIVERKITHSVPVDERKHT